MESIGESAFASTALTKLVIPPNVTRIGPKAFAGTNYLTEIVITTSTIQTPSSEFDETKDFRVLDPDDAWFKKTNDMGKIVTVTIPEALLEDCTEEDFWEHDYTLPSEVDLRPRCPKMKAYHVYGDWWDVRTYSSITGAITTYSPISGFKDISDYYDI